MSAPASPLPQNPDLGEIYQQLYDDLGRAYWETTGTDNKDLIHGTQEALGNIITQIDEDDLAANTALFLQLKPSIDAVNQALDKIKSEINTITRNLDTASKIIAGVNKALALVPKVAAFV